MSELLLERPPESEIYGRSLSTIYRLGAFMVGKTLEESTKSPEADQTRAEFYTSVEEGFGTDVELGGGLEVRDFDERPVVDGRVMSKDLKTAISDMTDAGLTCAKSTAEEDQRFVPQLVRTKWDHQNALLVDKMAQGETNYNTRIVISPFPEEAAAQSGSEYWRNIGYVPHLRRGFVQLYHATEGKVIAGSLSFDGSSKQNLREVLGQWGVEVPDWEVTDNWLKYAVTATLSENKAKELAILVADEAAGLRREKSTNTVDVTRKHRSIMDKVFDESYVHISESLFRGFQTEGVSRLILQLANQAPAFNQRYTKALYKMRANPEEFTDDDSVVLHELLVYSTIEMMRAFHKGTSDADAIAIQPSSDHFLNMLGRFGAYGARNNRTYSACGLSISPGEDAEEGLMGPQAAFGGRGQIEDSNSNESKKNWKWKSGVCVVPRCPTRPGKTKVGPCSVCKCCQLQFDMGKDPTQKYKYTSN